MKKGRGGKREDPNSQRGEFSGNQGKERRPPGGQGRPKPERRDGDWDCLSCNFVNYAKNQVCYRCKVPKSGSVQETLPVSSRGSSTSIQSVIHEVSATSEDIQQPKQTFQEKQSVPGTSADKPKEKADWKKKDKAKKKQETSKSQTPTTSKPTEITENIPKSGPVQETLPESSRGSSTSVQSVIHEVSTTTDDSQGIQSVPGTSADKPKEKADWKKKDKAKKKQEKQEPSTSRPSSTPKTTEISENIQNLQLSGKFQVLSDPNNPSRWEGTKGKRFTTEVNFLPIVLINLPDTAYHYDVTFNPDRPKKFLQPALDLFFGILNRENSSRISFAFDGKKNIYTAKELPGAREGLEKTVVVTPPQAKGREFKVTIKFATEISMGILKKRTALVDTEKPEQALQCLEVVLKTVFKTQQGNPGIVIKRAIYNRPNDVRSLGMGWELWRGLIQSVVLSRKQPYLNVDLSHKGFPEAMGMSVMDTMKIFTWNGRFNDRGFQDYLRQLDIEYTLNGQKKIYRCNGLVGPADRQKFTLDNGAQKTVLQYFKEQYKVNLSRPDLPCLHVGPREKSIYLPMEFCRIPQGQAKNFKLPQNCTDKIANFAASSSMDRKRNIQDLYGNLNYQGSQVILDFGVKIDKGFEKVEARVIAPPMIQYRDGSASVAKGVWNKTGCFKEAAQLPQGKPIKWAIINCAPVNIKDFRGKILTEARKEFVNLDPNVHEINLDWFKERNPEGKLEELLSSCKRAGFLFVFVVLGQKAWRPHVRRAAELKVKILAQCVLGETISNRMYPSTLSNIFLKVNAKLNGVNHDLIDSNYKAWAANAIFVGADVNHPAPDNKITPSVVGVVSSFDSSNFGYRPTVRLQNHRVEMIQNFKQIMVDQLQFYKKKTGKFPEKIFYYRDGVSEGQFQVALDIELSAMKDACKALNCPAKITFGVVRKRHRTRFFPQARDGDGTKNNNVPAGTIVDKDIVDKDKFEYYLTSHTAIKGTARPAKYTVIYDENGISADDMESLSYSLCHLFARCNRSVSLPTPTYYAHLVAERGKEYIAGQRLNLSQLEAENLKIKTALDELSAEYPMFFV